MFSEVLDSIPVDKNSNESVNFLSRYRLYHSLIQVTFSFFFLIYHVTK